MSIEAGLIGFAALTSLSLAMKKHRPKLAPPFLPPPLAARTLGWALLALSAAAAIAQVGPAMGVVTWIGQLCVAGALLVLLLSWRPQLTPGLAWVAMICAPLLARL